MRTLAKEALITNPNPLLVRLAKIQLCSQLAHYGLNPEQWVYESFDLNSSESRGKARLKHQNDPNLQIIGVFEKDALSLRSLLKFQWRHLEWDL